VATTILTLHSLSHILAQKAAQDRSLQSPVFGLEEEIDGVIIGHNINSNKMNMNRTTQSRHHLPGNINYYTEGLVIEMEHRRKSGRGVLEWYFLPIPTSISSSLTSRVKQKGSQQEVWLKDTVILLDDHPLYRRAEGEEEAENSWGEKDGEGDTTGSTFELGLTERQRKERDAVVLPYFDAQRGDGPGEGGRILYDMGEEDDFDEEEDEI
jgi:elongator complex protein 5